MPKRPSTRNLVMLCVLAGVLSATAWQFYRSPAARATAVDLVSPLTRWVASTFQAQEEPRAPGPTRAEKRAQELAIRLAERVPRPPRERFPERPRVAIMDFRIDRDTWVGAQTARQLSDLARSSLSVGDRFDWVDREQLDAALNEAAMSLGVGDAAASVELGSWLDCDLIVTGRFVDTGEPTQRLWLEVIDLLTADCVAGLELPWAANLREAGSLTDADLDRLLLATEELLADAHQRLSALRDKPVLSLLFVRNVTGHDRLNHLELVLSEQVATLAEAQGDVRLVRVTRAEAAGEEQTLALNGLTQRDPLAWARVADHYLWAFVSESQNATPDSANGGILMDPDQVPTTVQFNLWSGVDAPRSFSRTAPRGEIEASVAELTREVMAAAQVPVSAEVSPGQRDAVVALLTGWRTPTPLQTRSITDENQLAAGPNAGRGGGATRRLTQQAARFFKPEDQTPSFSLGSAPTRKPWTDFLAREAEFDRILRLHASQIHGIRVGAGSCVELIRQRWNFVANDSPRGRRSGHPHVFPADMPPAAREAFRRETVERLIRFGQLLSVDARAQPDRPRVNSGLVYPVLNEEHPMTPTERANVVTAWWPLLQPLWESERGSSHRYVFDNDKLAHLSAAFAAAGRSAEYDTLFSLPEVAAVPAYDAGPLTAEQAARLKAWVDAKVAEEVFPAERLTPRARRVPPPPAAAAAPASAAAAASTAGQPSLLELTEVPANTPAHLRETLGKAIELRQARYSDAAGTPRHVEQPALSAAEAASAVNLTWDFSLEREFRFTPRAEEEQVEFHRVVPWQGRYAGLRAPVYDRRNPVERTSVHSTGLGLLDPLTLGVWPLRRPGQPAEWTDLTASATSLWLATPRSGVVRMSPWGEQTAAFGTEDGLISESIRRIAFDGERVWVLSEDGRLGLVENPEAEPDDIRMLDARFDRRFALEHLEAAGGRVAVAGGAGQWSWVTPESVEPVGEWLAANTPHGGQNILNIRADGDAFWVVTVDRLMQVSGDGRLLRDLPLHAPPLETLQIRADGDLVWMAYTWEEIDTTPRLRRSFSRSRLVDPNREAPRRPLTRLLAVDGAGGEVLGQTQWAGELAWFFVAHDELHLFASTPDRDVAMLPRESLLAAMGLAPGPGSPAAPAAANPLVASTSSTSATPPWSVPANAWAAYRGEASAAASPHPGEPDAWPPLLAAVRAGRADTVKELLAAGADPDAATFGRFSHNAALLAVLLNRPDLLTLLHEAGADLNVTHAAFGTLVHAAVLSNRPELIAHLGSLGADLEPYARMPRHSIPTHGRHPPYRSVPLHLAIHRGFEACVRALLDAGASVRNEHLIADRITPLREALRLEQETIATLLLDHGADPRLDDEDENERPVLDFALSVASPSLLERFAITSEDSLSPTGLEGAIDEGDAEAVRLLLAAGADPWSLDDVSLGRAGFGFGVPALRALSRGRFDLYRLMTPPGDPRLDRVVSARWRLGDLAATTAMDRLQHTEAIALVARGFSIDVPNQSGQTLLAEWAARQGVGIEALIEARMSLALALGADPNATDSVGLSVMALAWGDARKVLLQNAETHVRRLRGMSP